MGEKGEMNQTMVSRQEQKKQSTVFTSLCEDTLTSQEREGVEHLLEMMVVAKQQILLRKALGREGSCCI